MVFRLTNEMSGVSRMIERDAILRMRMYMKPEKLIKRRRDHMTNATTDRMSESDNELYHRIAMAAYELYERRGRIDGQDLEDWFKAETIANSRAE